MHRRPDQGDVGKVEAPHVEPHIPAIQCSCHHPATTGAHQVQAPLERRAGDDVNDHVVPPGCGPRQVSNDAPVGAVHYGVRAGLADRVSFAARAHRHDPGAASGTQGYAGHYCSLPTRTDPTVVCCSMIASGLRLFDIRRWKIAETVMPKTVVRGIDYINSAGVLTTATVPASARSFNVRAYLWPIPQTELDLNTNLTQNPGF